TQQAVVETIIDKHDVATGTRRFNAILATASINDAIEYYHLFRRLQKQKIKIDKNFVPLNVACVFSPPAEGNKDIRQIQEDLEQEKEDNKENPREKKLALKNIVKEYNKQYGTNHSINEFDLYYKDVQKRIKDHQYSNADYPHKNKIDIAIVVDMLLTGFDSKYLNTLYVDKNLKYHGLIQAFSRTNRVLNDTKPYGNILDFRRQQEAVDIAIALFSGEDTGKSREIWLVEPATDVIEKYKESVKKLDDFMTANNLVCEPEAVYNLRGDAARIAFIKNFKEVQRLKTHLDQYTDLDEEQLFQIEQILPNETLRSFRSSYIETAKQFREIQQKEGVKAPPELQQLDFEFVLFASAMIDYDYIMELIAESTQKRSNKQKMTKSQIINLLSSNSNLMDEQEDLTEYISSLDWNIGRDVNALHEGYELFKIEKQTKELTNIAFKHGLSTVALKDFIDEIMSRMIFDGEKLNDLFAPLALGWKVRTQKELALMEDLVPILKKQAQGREISGLSAYED
ncbi:MAG: type I restriction endonuclease subunit R, partial [Tannerella sp.]|nr:type I restriction endonuclease subunit R [Tannerella sp.]